VAKSAPAGKKQVSKNVDLKNALGKAIDASKTSYLDSKKQELSMIDLDLKIAKAELEKLRALERKSQEFTNSRPFHDAEASNLTAAAIDAEAKIEVSRKALDELRDPKSAVSLAGDIARVKADTDYLIALREHVLVQSGKDVQYSGEIDAMKHELSYLDTKRKHEATFVHDVAVECPFSLDATSSFYQNFDALEEGRPSGVAMFMPSSMASLTRNYVISGSGRWSSYSGVLPIAAADCAGWEESVLISDFAPPLAQSKLSMSTQSKAAVFGACTLAGSVIGGGSRIKAGIAGYALGFSSSVLCDFMTYITHAELRALVTKKFGASKDTRPVADRVLDTSLDDTLVELRPFVVLTLVCGAKVLSFDPTTTNLYGWSASTHCMLGVVATDQNRRFRPLTISTVLFTESVSRRTLTSSVFDKARAVERVNKILENCDRKGEEHRMLLYSGISIFKDTLTFVTALLNRAPHTQPQDF
jgi:hypothetical protein